jgi:hypothetical protein
MSYERDFIWKMRPQGSFRPCRTPTCCSQREQVSLNPIAPIASRSQENHLNLTFSPLVFFLSTPSVRTLDKVSSSKIFDAKQHRVPWAATLLYVTKDVASAFCSYQ